MEVFGFFFALCITVGYGKVPNKIVGGSIAGVNEFPYQASIRTNGNHMCGGAIISNRHILTAAHCFVEPSGKVAKAENFEILVGVNDRVNVAGGQTLKMKTYNYHRNFNYTVSNKNDIALILLAEPIVFNAAVKAINLPTTDAPVGSLATVSGWGAVNYPPLGLPRDLKKVQLTITSNESCGEKFKRQMQPGQICGFTAKGHGTCVGDSGGPMALNNELIGVVSWGQPCAIGQPDVFTRVHHYLTWINSILKEIK